MADKTLVLKFTPREIGRGEWGKKFYISTFRFPLTEAQKFERRAKAMGLTMSSLANQLVMTFNKTVAEPKGTVKLERTNHPTIWGSTEKKKYFKAKGVKVPVKRVEKPVTKKVVAKKAKKPVAETKLVKTAKKPAESKGSASLLLAKLKAMRAKNAAA